MIDLDTHPCSGITTIKGIKRTSQWSQTAFRDIQIAQYAPKFAPVGTGYLIERANFGTATHRCISRIKHKKVPENCSG